ncbi:MAG: outer membrane lipoprotein-sorting protein [Desulfobulbaceae bacterium]|nr:outer membrane lipoprotein-sorting protein [Desulfobulbaceae bacterium]
MVFYSYHSALIFLFLLFFNTFAEAAPISPETGQQIMQKAEERDRGFGDYTASMRMVLHNKQGEKSERSIRVMVMEGVEDGDKTLAIFDTPADVKGTAFLTHSRKASDDDQWLYLPALKRVKRIAPRNKSGSFMGSEFSYEDIGGRVLEKYEYKRLEDAPLEGQDCFVIEEHPKDAENSGYSKLVTWLDKQDYKILKVEYYDRKQAVLKTLTSMDYQKYSDKYWRAAEMYMYNHQTGKSTTLYWSKYDFGKGLTDRDFDKNSLSRAR